MKTLNQIADILSVSTNTIRNKITKYENATGIDFYSFGQSDPLDSRRTIYPQAEVEKLIQFIDPTFQLASQSANQTASQPQQIEIEMGNHAQSKALTVSAKSSNLEQFRTDRIRQGLANPQEFMSGLDSMLDQIELGMDAAEAEQEQELQQLRLIKRKTQKRVEQFRRRSDEYRLKTDILASIQNSELDELEELTTEVNALGKQG